MGKSSAKALLFVFRIGEAVPGRIDASNFALHPVRGAVDLSLSLAVCYTCIYSGLPLRSSHVVKTTIPTATVDRCPPILNPKLPIGKSAFVPSASHSQDVLSIEGS